jgi:hypothetical protein
MAVYYWVSKAGGWAGPTGAGTESSPFLGAIGLRNAFNAGTISATGGHTIIFMGEYGPVLGAEIWADFPNSLKLITDPLTSTWPVVGPEDAVNRQGGIIFGNANGNSSNCKDNIFKFRGDFPYHIDARGATTNAQRMKAALYIQGNRNRIEGPLRIAQPNWDWIGGGSGRVPASVIGAGAILAHESSYENFGVVMHGWGCQMDGVTPNAMLSWGADSFGRTSFRIVLSMLDAPANSGGSLTYIQNTDSYGCSDGPQIVFDGGQVNGGLFETRFMPEAGARAYVRWNRMRGLRWGDSASTPLVNNSNVHGNMLNMANGAWTKGDARIYGNECSGFCQDTIETIAQNVKIHDNYIHDINPGYVSGATILHWTNTAGAWAQVPNAVLGSGIKCGLGGLEGQLTGTVWPSLGVVGGDPYRTSAFRVQVFRNLIENNSQDGMQGIATNGNNGTIIHANEIINFGRGISLVRTGVSGSDIQAHWVSNNYVRSRDNAFSGFTNTTAWLYNNIFNGNLDFNWSGATGGHTIIGANNRFVNNTTNFGTGPVNLLTGTTTGAANYTEKVGPTAGGNCAAAGSWQGIVGARNQFTLRDLRGSAWLPSRLPAGPYRG